MRIFFKCLLLSIVALIYVVNFRSQPTPVEFFQMGIGETWSAYQNIILIAVWIGVLTVVTFWDDVKSRKMFALSVAVVVVISSLVLNHFFGITYTLRHCEVGGKYFFTNNRDTTTLMLIQE